MSSKSILLTILFCSLLNLGLIGDAIGESSTEDKDVVGTLCAELSVKPAAELVSTITENTADKIAEDHGEPIVEQKVEDLSTQQSKDFEDLSIQRSEDVVFKKRNVILWPIYCDWKNKEGDRRRIVGPVTTCFTNTHSNEILFDFIWPKKTLFQLVWPNIGWYSHSKFEREIFPIYPFSGYSECKNNVSDKEYTRKYRIKLLWPMGCYGLDKSVSRETYYKKTNIRVIPLIGYRNEVEQEGNNERRHKEINWLIGGCDMSKSVREQYYFQKTDVSVLPLLMGYRNETEQKVYSVKSSSFLRIGLFEKSSSSDGKKLTAFYPFYLNYRSVDTHNLFYTPVYSLKNKERHVSGIFPLYHKKEGLTDNSIAIWPLGYYRHKNLTEGIEDKITLLYYNLQDKNKIQTGLFPFYRIEHFKNGSYDSYRGLLWGWGKGRDARHFQYLLPFYAEKSGYKNNNYQMITPLWWKFQNTDKNSSQLFILPSYWHKEYYLSPQKRYLSEGLFPLYSYRCTPKEMGYEKQISLLLRLYFHKANEEACLKYTSICWPLFINRQTGSETMTSFIYPCYYHKTNPEYRKLQILSFIDEKGKNISRTCLYPLYYEYDNLETQLNRKYFFPSVFINKTPSVFRWAAHPFYSYRQDNTINLNEHRALLSILKYAKSPEISSYHIFPFIWRSTGREHDNFVLAPFYWNNSDQFNKKLMISPLYWYSQSPIAREYLLLPLFHKKFPPVRLWIIASSLVSQQLLQREKVAPLAEKEPQRV
ncbi:hypothetical protein KKE26_04085 [bacterium]|nr:hypothetical protein [bacterium]